jgi:ankyrin repeat protein
MLNVIYNKLYNLKRTKMSTFINFGDRNFFRNFCKELDTTKARDPAPVFVHFQNSGALIGKVDESKWTVFDLRQVSAGIYEQVKNVNEKLAQSPQNSSTLRHLEVMLNAFKKIEKVATDLYKASGEIVIRNGLTYTTFEQAYEILTNTSTLHSIHALVEKIEATAFEILEKAAPNVNWKESIDTENSFLHSAISQNKKELALILIESGADLESYNSFGNTPLLSACIKGDLDLVTALLAKGACVDKKNEDGASPLHKACAHGHLNIVQELLKHGAQVNAQAKNKNTPLITACRKKGNLEIVKALLAHGADVNKTGHNGQSALLKASSKGSLSVVQELLKNRAAVNKADSGGNTALHVAVLIGNVDIARALLAKKADPNMQNAEGTTALHFACRGSLKSVQDLLNHGANALIKDNDGATSLLYASRTGDLDLVKALLAKVGQIEDTEPLMEACKHGHLEIYQTLFGVLVTQGADLNKQKQIILSAFHNACVGNAGYLYVKPRNRPRLIQWLLEHGAADLINSEDADGKTALHIVCEKGYAEVIPALLEKGADINKKDKNGTSALYFACVKQHLEVVKELLKHGVLVDSEDNKGFSPLMAAVLFENIEIPKVLLAKGADINKKDKNGMTALRLQLDHCGYYGTRGQWLVENGAHIDVEDNTGTTPLLAACHKGSVKAACFLLDKGADINKQNRAGDTALSLSIKKESAALIKLLLERNIKESHFLKSKDGATPLHMLFTKPNLIEPEALVALFLKLSTKFDITCKDSAKRTPLAILSFQNPAVANKVINQIFPDFGVMEKVLNTKGIGYLIYLIGRPEELIAHPKNHPLANPLTVALLYDSKVLAYEIALKLSTQEFLNKCQELEKAYPKTPVLTFLFETFISSPSLDRPPLPEGHINALFSYLCTKIDVTYENEALETPFQHLLSLNHFYATKILVELLDKFGSSARIQLLIDRNRFLAYFIENPIELVDDFPKESDANPLEVAFLFGSIPLARAIASKMTKKKFQAYALELEKSFPKSPSTEFLFNVEYSINPVQFTKGVTVIPEKPPGVEARDLLTLFDKINFINPSAPLYFNPETHGLSSDCIELRKILEDFITKIETRQEYLGTPKKDTDAIKTFYKIIENAVTNTIKKLQTVNDENLSATTVIEYLNEVALCGGKIFAISVEIFNKVVLNIDANFETRVFSSLGELRSIFARDVIPASEQNVHDYNKFVRVKGKTLGIPGSVEGAQFEDTYTGSQEFNADKSEKKFLELYKPAQISLKWLEPQLKTDATLRERFTAWWKNHVPAAWGKEKYEPIKQKIAELKANRASHQQIEQYLENLDIYLDKTSTPEEVVEDVRRHAFIEREVYDDMAANTFKKALFMQSLIEIGVLLKAPIEYVKEPKKSKKQIKTAVIKTVADNHMAQAEVEHVTGFNNAEYEDLFRPRPNVNAGSGSGSGSSSMAAIEVELVNRVNDTNLEYEDLLRPISNVNAGSGSNSMVQAEVEHVTGFNDANLGDDDFLQSISNIFT